MQTQEQYESPGFPEWWSWDDDGERIDGTFVAMGKGFTSYGPRPYVVLQLDDGSERTIWLHNDVLRNVFAREVYARPSQQLDVGERITVWRLGERESANARRYMDFRARFENAHIPSQAEILGPPPETMTKPDDEDERLDADDAPF
jgi:hypothetical protein